MITASRRAERSAAFAPFLASLLIVRHFVRLPPRWNEAVSRCDGPPREAIGGRRVHCCAISAIIRCSAGASRRAPALSFVFCFLKGLFNFVHFLDNSVAVSARACARLKIFAAVIFSIKGKRKGTSRRIQRAEQPFPVIMLSLRSERTQQTQHLRVLFLTGRMEEVEVVVGIQTLEPGSFGTTFPLTRWERTCCVYFFCSYQTMASPCDKRHIKRSRRGGGGVGVPVAVATLEASHVSKNNVQNFPLNGPFPPLDCGTSSSRRNGRIRAPLLDVPGALCDVTPPPLAVW